jgi:hypothetical protein
MALSSAPILTNVTGGAGYTEKQNRDKTNYY